MKGTFRWGSSNMYYFDTIYEPFAIKPFTWESTEWQAKAQQSSIGWTEMRVKVSQNQNEQFEHKLCGYHSFHLRLLCLFASAFV